ALTATLCAIVLAASSILPDDSNSCGAFPETSVISAFVSSAELVRLPTAAPAFGSFSGWLPAPVSVSPAERPLSSKATFRAFPFSAFFVWSLGTATLLSADLLLLSSLERCMFPWGVSVFLTLREDSRLPKVF
ncbi:hypothetical protein XELAEV_18024732mg, partial [Xenopus laevis]